VIEPLCGSEFITLPSECQGHLNPRDVARLIEPLEKTRIAEEVAILMCMLIVDRSFPQRLPGD